jgi:Zn finger protein HypA/HybF involved in hydrogenase expression
MIETDPTPSADTDLYVCKDCGEGVKTLVGSGKCPKCGGRMVDTTVPHD